jgi:beta-ureidopropionase / N-carbamoyl-L-amino-acid hydrolase
MSRIDPQRLLKDLRDLARFGAYKTGVHRPSLSADDLAARRWVMQRFAEAGLEPEIDGIGSVFGWSARPGPRLLTGSHIESQNHSGWLDGPLGVIYGLEAARALGADPDTRHIAVDVAAWFDEEGHFGSFLGSRSGIGMLTDADVAAAENRYGGGPLSAALAAAGLAGKPRRIIDGARYVGYCEAHIEQGDTLESSGNRIGVVTAIVGIWQYRVTFDGTQNHAGTTRMAIRRDAGLALTKLCQTIASRFPEIAGPRTVWTTGRITLEPGAPSIIPGRAEMLFQIRDADPATLERMQGELMRLVAAADSDGPCRVALEALSRSTPAAMDEGLQRALDAAAEAQAPGRHLRMPSGAGHDARYLARIMPSSMLFVPSIGGISHHWTENTSDDDIVLGCQVYVDALARMAGVVPGLAARPAVG